MKSLWNDKEASGSEGDPLRLRVYTSRLLGREPSLVLHGGGNTSVKTTATTLFGDREDLLYIKGSGWDLATIEAAGFAPVRLQVLTRMAELPRLTDTEMVRAQRAAMTDPGAPTPSVEAILHAIIPFTFVDHTHADAVVAISNTPGGEARIREVYQDRVLVVPYVMPGFVLARKVFELSRGLDWSRYEGMVLLHHGDFQLGQRCPHQLRADDRAGDHGGRLSPEEEGVDRRPSSHLLHRSWRQRRGAGTRPASSGSVTSARCSDDRDPRRQRRGCGICRTAGGGFDRIAWSSHSRSRHPDQAYALGLERRQVQVRSKPSPRDTASTSPATRRRK